MGGCQAEQGCPVAQVRAGWRGWLQQGAVEVQQQGPLQWRPQPGPPPDVWRFRPWSSSAGEGACKLAFRFRH
jgi:hypothetical protein